MIGGHELLTHVSWPCLARPPGNSLRSARQQGPGGSAWRGRDTVGECWSTFIRLAWSHANHPGSAAPAVRGDEWCRQ